VTVDKNKLDVVQIFEAYVTFGGNAAKTAAACNVESTTVEALAKAEGWHATVERWNVLGISDVREVQVQINRAVNYVQASRLRSLLDKVIRHLGEGDADALVNRLTVETAHGAKFGTRPLTDLVKAAEAVQLMSQRALGDVPAETPEKDARKGSSIALGVMAALDAANSDLSLDSTEVVKKQLAAPHDSSPRTSPAQS
jgi:hypothetical protein